MLRTYPESATAGVGLIAVQTLAADAASVTFSAIPQNFRHLRLVASLRATVAAINDDIGIQLNGDATGVYQRDRQIMAGATAPTADPAQGSTTAYIARAVAGSLNANEWSPLTVDFPDYTNTGRWKMMLARSGITDATTANAQLVSSVATRIVNAAITSINIVASSGSIKAGSTFSLYGLK